MALDVSDTLAVVQARLSALPEGHRVAEELVAAVLAVPRLELPLCRDRLVAEAEARQLADWTERALAHEPLQYILGHTSFRGLTICCDRRALIPRPETEQLVELVLSDPYLQSLTAPRWLDVGTGTGCVALALAQERPQSMVWAVDVDADALALARENAAALGLTDRVRFTHGHLLEGQLPDCMDAIVANLPYIASDECDQLDPTVRLYEPRRALDGGVDGLRDIEDLIRQAAAVLRPHGRIFLEMGMEQGRRVADMLASKGFEQVRMIKDLAERDRFAVGVRP